MSIKKALLFFVFLLAAAGGAYYYFVYKPVRPVAGEFGYVLPATIPVVDTPAEVRLAVGSLKGGDRVQILKRTQHWSQVRTPESLTGWVENVNLLDAATYEGGQKLLHELQAVPPQAAGHTSGIVNLHLEPSRDAAQLAQLPENVKLDIYGRRWVDRPVPDGQPSAPKARDAWYLIRTDSQAGWVMGRFVALDFPEKLAPFAQDTNMVGWVVLKTVDDDGQQVPEYVTAERMGTQEADFSHIRVFTWWMKNHMYVTAYVESGLNGYFPIRVSEANGVYYFRLRLINEQGQKYQKVYGLYDTITRVVGTVPGWDSEAMPEPSASHAHHRARRKS